MGVYSLFLERPSRMVSGKAVNVVAGGYASLIKATEEVGAQSRCLMPAPCPGRLDEFINGS